MMRAALLEATAVLASEGGDAIDLVPDMGIVFGASAEWEPEPYLPWEAHTATAESDTELFDLVLEVVGAEGPIICGRLYRMVAEAIGISPEAVRSRLNKLVYGAVRYGRLAQVEPLGQGQMNKTVMLVGAGPVRARMLGPRTVWEYPRIEMQELVRRVIVEFDDEEELLQDGELTGLVVTSILGVERESWEGRYLEESAFEAHALLTS